MSERKRKREIMRERKRKRERDGDRQYLYQYLILVLFDPRTLNANSVLFCIVYSIPEELKRDAFYIL